MSVICLVEKTEKKKHKNYSKTVRYFIQFTQCENGIDPVWSNKQAFNKILN